MAQSIRSGAERAGSYLRRVLVEQPQRNGWLKTLVGRLIVTNVLGLCAMTFCLMVGVPLAGPLMGMGLALLLTYISEWLWRWRIRRQVNRRG